MNGRVIDILKMRKKTTTDKLRLVPLGGLGEIGKNMMALEYGPDMVIIDAGLMFPEAEMLGVDLVIPDFSYVLERQEKVRGVLITHGHEDHTGALPYLLRQLNVPVYSTRLTHGLISVKLKEHRLLERSKLHVYQPGDRVQLGRFTVEPFRVSHSISDAVGLIIHTPLGVVIHSGDFKLDHTPVDGKLMDLSRLAQLGGQGVLLLMSDSTYVELPGYTPSEKNVGETLERVIAEAPGRVIVATFASLISRIQQVINAAAKHDRKVFITGRSMVENVRVATSLGYLSAPDGILGRTEDLHRLPKQKVVIVTTGSQGEPTSVLVRMANHDHRQLHILPGDTVVISASPIPGNESLVYRTVNGLFKQGARVLYSNIADVHVHGHGSQEELKLLINLVKPKFFVPVHGEYRHLSLHAKLAQSLGVPEDHTLILEDGDVLEVGRDTARVVSKVQASNVYIDGLSVGDIGNVVLRDRKLLSRDGIVVVIMAVDKSTGKLVSRPDIVSRGFVDMQESEDLIEAARNTLMKSLDHGGMRNVEWGYINAKVKDLLGQLFFEKTKRRPMILPVTMEV